MALRCSAWASAEAESMRSSERKLLLASERSFWLRTVTCAGQQRHGHLAASSPAWWAYREQGPVVGGWSRSSFGQAASTPGLSACRLQERQLCRCYVRVKMGR
jgi:hypothetical protein